MGTPNLTFAAQAVKSLAGKPHAFFWAGLL